MTSTTPTMRTHATSRVMSTGSTGQTRRRAFTGALAGLVGAGTVACGMPGLFGSGPNPALTSSAADSALPGRSSSIIVARPRVVPTVVAPANARNVVPRPPDPKAPGLMWFDPQPRALPDEAPERPGLWRRNRIGAYWQWDAIDPEVTGVQVYDRSGRPPMPPWPEDAATLRIERYVTPNGLDRGYWVWNAANFAGSTWSPGWEWVGDGRPHLLVATGNRS